MCDMLHCSSYNTKWVNYTLSVAIKSSPGSSIYWQAVSKLGVVHSQRGRLPHWLESNNQLTSLATHAYYFRACVSDVTTKSKEISGGGAITVFFWWTINRWTFTAAIQFQRGGRHEVYLELPKKLPLCQGDVLFLLSAFVLDVFKVKLVYVLDTCDRQTMATMTSLT